MRFADPNAGSTAYLILRHLYDGDIIDWPIPDDHPQRAIFAQLESEGYVARWDRIWPLQDRYRLTEKGIATIEAVYQPAGAEAFFEELRRQNLRPVDRRAYLTSRRLDPGLWPILHDPSTHWSTWPGMSGIYQSYLWEDHRPPQRRRPPPAPAKAVSGRGSQHRDYHDERWRHDRARAPYLVDLDRQRSDNDEPSGLTQPDYDVS